MQAESQICTTIVEEYRIDTMSECAVSLGYHLRLSLSQIDDVVLFACSVCSYLFPNEVHDFSGSAHDNDVNI